MHLRVDGMRKSEGRHCLMGGGGAALWRTGWSCTPGVVWRNILIMSSEGGSWGGMISY